MRIKLEVYNATIIYILFAMIFMGGHILKMQPLVANFLIALIGICAFVYAIMKNSINGSNSYLILVGVLYSAFMFFSLLYNRNADYLDLLWIWAYMGIAMLSYEFTIPQKIYWCVAYVIIVLICIYVVRGGAANELLSMGSQNNISVYVIFFVIMGYLSVMREKKVIKYYAGFLTFAISLWTGSRAGIISSFLLLSGTFLYNFFAVKGQKTKSLVKLCIMSGFAIWAVNHFFSKYLLGLTAKLARYRNASIRTEIWKEYVHGVLSNFGNLFLGVNTSDEIYHWLSFYNGNTHNSFLMLHAKFGLFAFVVLIVLIFFVIHKSIEEKNYVMMVILMAAIARMFFDWIAFPGLYDVLFWYMFLYVLDRNNMKTKDWSN